MSKQISLTNTFVKPKPFLKWAGGKTQLLEQFDRLFPQSFNNYIEPMVGGGAVFFHLYTNGRIKNKSILVDINRDLMSCFEVVKNNVEDLVLKLKEFKKKYQIDPEKTYYQIRKWDRNDNFINRSKIERVARTIFLNKTCYNGLYRVNSSGQFNTPVGRYSNPTICDEENLRAVSDILKKTKLLSEDFETTLDIVSSDDFIYFDPPYHPLSDTANFTSYTQEDFSEDNQKRLKDVFEELAKMGCKVMLSNSDTKFIRELYQDFNIHIVRAKRYINSNPNHRGEVTEVVVTNY